jgi:hypothetical protein
MGGNAGNVCYFRVSFRTSSRTLLHERVEWNFGGARVCVREGEASEMFVGVPCRDTDADPCVDSVKVCNRRPFMIIGHFQNPRVAGVTCHTVRLRRPASWRS